MNEDVFEEAGRRYELAAEEFEAAARHLRVSAEYFRSRAVPRGCAHAWAARGHALNAQRELDDLAVLHASKAVPTAG